jgi:hypothetical protein
MLPPWAVTWAQEAINPPGWDAFAQYSVLGIAVIGLGLLVYRIFMQLWNRSGEELTREISRGDRLEAENKLLNLAMQEKAIPALLAAATAISECTELMRSLQQERDYALRRQHRDGDAR